MNPVCAMTEINRVQIHFENLIFCISAFDLNCGNHFLYLAGKSFLHIQIENPRELLCQSTCSLFFRKGQNVNRNSSYHVPWTNPPMLSVPYIFRRNKSIYDMLWYLAEGHKNSSFGEKFVNENRIRRVDPGYKIRIKIF